MIKRAAIIGTVGVPARYGGFETLAQALADRISAQELALTIYCQKSKYAEVERDAIYRGHTRVFLPLPANGALSMVYDATSILDAIIRQRCRTLICLGASAGLAFAIARLLFPHARLIFNLDGMESRRARWSGLAKALLGLLEWLGVKLAHVIVSDNQVIHDMVLRRYGKDSVVIAYGGDNAAPGEAERAPDGFSPPRDYLLAISRIVPENNVHLVLEAFACTGTSLVYVGNWDASDYGRDLRARFAGKANLHLLDPIYDKTVLDFLRKRARACVHGHSVGGTNPALVEAVFWAPQILAFDCDFNRATLGGAFCYWHDTQSLAGLLKQQLPAPAPATVADLRRRYRWDTITAKYREIL
jgi:glycosyltransferase involved in cell wall biosynthesis